MPTVTRPFALVTGASIGIGYELAKRCAENGVDLLIAAYEPAINEAAPTFRTLGSAVETIEADLATLKGVDKLYAAAKRYPVKALLANAGRSLGQGFLDQNFDEVRHVIGTHILGILYLRQKVGKRGAPVDRAVFLSLAPSLASCRALFEQSSMAPRGKKKLQSAIAHVTLPGVLAEQHRKMAESGSAKQ